MIINEPAAYRTERPVTWCPGCGDVRVLEALCHALTRSGVDPAGTVLVTGSGCSSMIGFFVNSYAIHGPYGRALPIALGVKLANPSLTVIVAGGDGDAYAAGAGHLIHLARKNPDLTYLIMDNGCYGLTKGQPSPTAGNGAAGATAVDHEALNPVALLIATGATFVAQGSSDDSELLTRLMQEALHHRGFSAINIISPCAVLGRQPSTRPPDAPESVRIDPATHPSHDRMAALQLATVRDGRTRVGVFYREERNTLHSGLDVTLKRDGYDDLISLERIMNGMKP
jgi:2-oxoglutarate ferredoxin oxidoreductase subunit beta